MANSKNRCSNNPQRSGPSIMPKMITGILAACQTGSGIWERYFKNHLLILWAPQKEVKNIYPAKNIRITVKNGDILLIIEYNNISTIPIKPVPVAFRPLFIRY